MMHKFSYEHNIEHSRSKIRILHPKTIGKIYLELNYVCLSSHKIIYKLWHNCSSHGHNTEHNRQIFELAQKHNR